MVSNVNMPQKATSVEIQGPLNPYTIYRTSRVIAYLAKEKPNERTTTNERF